MSQKGKRLETVKLESRWSVFWRKWYGSLECARYGEAQMALLCNEAHEFNCKKTLIKFKIDSANRISTDAIAARVRVFPVL